MLSARVLAKHPLGSRAYQTLVDLLLHPLSFILQLFNNIHAPETKAAMNATVLMP